MIRPAAGHASRNVIGRTSEGPASPAEADAPVSRLEWLDFFRGGAALVVVGYHFRHYLAIEWMDWGFVAVQAFFVLSGLVLGRRYGGPLLAGLPFSTFALARMTRLYPMVFLSACLVLVLNAFDVPDSRLVPGAGTWPLDVFLLTSLSLSLFSVPSPAWPANSPVWSLWAELASNLVWFLALRFGKKAMAVTGLVCFVAMLALTVKFRYAGAGPSAGLSQRAVSLVSATAWFSVGYGLSLWKARPVVPVPVLLAALGACVAAFEWSGADAWIASIAIVLVATALIHSLSQMSPSSALVKTAARWLGLTSYPLYLLHAPASRLLPVSGGTSAHWLYVAVIVGGLTLVATLLNERIVPVVQSIARRKRRAANTPQTVDRRG